jgi:NADPH-dependent 2,4-dienoyl-CoA reductase/sulfur reductase-like enzyme
VNPNPKGAAVAGRLVVIGGGAAGMSAASAARRTDPTLEIVVLEGGAYAAYGMCGLPYFLSGTVDEAEDLVAYPPSFFREKRRLDLRLGTRATRLDIAERRVHFESAETGPGSLAYDRVVLAGGGIPTRPPALRLEDPRIFTVRALAEAVRLRELLDAKAIGRAVIVGGGYIGLEMAETLVESGVSVVLAEMLPSLMGTLDEPMAALVAAEVRAHGVDLRLNSAVSAVRRVGDRLEVTIGSRANGDAVEAVDAVIVASGVRAGSDLAAEAGAETGPNGALIVDDRMRTSLPDVLAAGDCVALHHLVLGRPAFIPLGPAANKTGRVAGTVAAGGDMRFPGVLGTAVVKVFDLAVARTGITLTEAQNEGIAATATDSVGRSRAKYYPGVEKVTVRLVHSPDGRLLGAQMAGRGDGIAKRIDVVAVALHAGFRIDDLVALDLSYAPPYAPVYEPLLLAAQAAGRDG